MGRFPTARKSRKKDKPGAHPPSSSMPALGIRRYEVVSSRPDDQPMDMSGPKPALGEICFAGFIIDLEGKIVGERKYAGFIIVYFPETSHSGQFCIEIHP